LQTQSIDSDAGLNHRFSFANVSVSARRRQFLTSDKVDLTLPQFSMSFSPVTLFRAPRGQEGFFNNMTLSGTGNLSRRLTQVPLATDTETTTGSLSGGLRLRNLNLSGAFAYDEVVTTEEDSTGVELPAAGVRQLNWNAGLDYQVNLIGSTTLRPNLRWKGGYFRSPNTGGDYATIPTQFSLGATLSTDIFGFYPGFAVFSRVRHKFSPGFSWAYAPAVAADSATASIPDFPFDSIRGRNSLTFTLRQTFEAKVRSSGEPPAAERAIGPAEPGLEAAARGFPDSLAADSAGVPAALADSAVAAVADAPAGRDTATEQATLLDPEGRGPPTQRPRDRVVTLLAINTSALVFDFERAKLGEPALTSTTVAHNITSDLLRGLSINMTHRLFDGTGPDRKLDLSLQQIAVSFSLRSGQGIGDLVGLGSGPERRTARERATGAGMPVEAEPDARSGLREFYDQDRYDPFDGSGSAGPWDLRLRYSLVRPVSGLESQTVDGTLTFQPTPKWAVRWTTQYNFTSNEFGQQFITLDRDLHRWRASFQFSRAPNGNVIFSVGVHLTDAPELKGDYQQKTN
jgi:hypothetical protein